MLRAQTNASAPVDPSATAEPLASLDTTTDTTTAPRAASWANRIVTSEPLSEAQMTAARDFAGLWFKLRLDLCARLDADGMSALYGSQPRSVGDELRLLVNPNIPEENQRTQFAQLLIAATEEMVHQAAGLNVLDYQPRSLTALHLLLRAELFQDEKTRLDAFLPLRHLFQFAASTSALPATQRVFGILFIPRLLAFFDDASATEFISSVTREQPANEAIDSVHFLYAVAAQRRGWGNRYDKVEHNICGALRSIAASHQSPLVSFAATLACSELENPESTVEKPGVVRGERTHDIRQPFVPGEPDRRAIKPHGYFLPDFHARKVARDALAATDINGLVQAYAPIHDTAVATRPGAWSAGLLLPCETHGHPS